MIPTSNGWGLKGRAPSRARLKTCAAETPLDFGARQIHQLRIPGVQLEQLGVDVWIAGIARFAHTLSSDFERRV